MTTFYLFKDAARELTCDSASNGIIDAFARAGCVPLTETQFLSTSVLPSSSDTVIVYISLKNELAHEKLRNLKCKKILHSMDESKSDEILFRTQLEFCSRHTIDTMINTFPSKRNVDFLASKGINTITMPFSGSPREVDFHKKDIDILISGQIDMKYYPIRGAIFNALRQSDVTFVHLPHAGLETSHASHQFHGKEFHKLLDRCWLGVTCRAGSFRDRIVPKYVEFGFSRVLPVGDVPTYMEKDMAESMVEINSNDSSQDIVKKIKIALSDRNDLIQRIERYSAVVHENYNMDRNVKHVLDMLNFEFVDFQGVK